MKKQQGFTLIELMIVVAIIGILAAIAIPAYQDYITRSKVTELVTAADACKTSVAEYFQSQSSLPDSTGQAGCSNNSSQYVAELTVTTAGEIQVKTAAPLTKAIGGTQSTLALTPTDNGADKPLSWVCNGANTTIPSKYLPANCRP